MDIFNDEESEEEYDDSDEEIDWDLDEEIDMDDINIPNCLSKAKKLNSLFYKSPTLNRKLISL